MMVVLTRTIISLILVSTIAMSQQPAVAEDNHQNGGSRMLWNSSGLGSTGVIEQEFTPLRIDWPSGYNNGSMFWYHINFCFEKTSKYGAGNTCGHVGFDMYFFNAGEYIATLELVLYDGQDFNRIGPTLKIDCEKRSPSSNVLNSNYIVCSKQVRLRTSTKYLLKLSSENRSGESWLYADLENPKSNESFRVGDIKGAANNLQKSFSSIATEIKYIGPPRNCSDVPIADYLVGNMKINNKKLDFANSSLDSCSTNAINQSSIPGNGFFFRTGGVNPKIRNYSLAEGSSDGSSQPKPSTSSTSQAPSSKASAKLDVKTPVISSVKFNGNIMNISANLGTKSAGIPDKVYLVAPKLGIFSSNPLPGRILGENASWSVKIPQNLDGTLVVLEITSQKDGIKSAPLSAEVKIPKTAIPTTSPKITPKPTAIQKVKCVRGSQSRIFDGTSCPPGYKKR